jgi:hypothetical protein
MRPHLRPLSPYLIASALFAAACSPNDNPTEPGAAAAEPNFYETQHLTNRTPFELTAVAQCTGEEVTLVGEVREALNLVVDETGELLHVSDHIVTDAVGTGASTGAKYLFHDVSRIDFNEPNLTAPQATFTTSQTRHTVSQGALDNRLLNFDFHITVTGQGVEKVTVDNFSLTCLG